MDLKRQDLKDDDISNSACSTGTFQPIDYAHIAQASLQQDHADPDVGIAWALALQTEEQQSKPGSENQENSPSGRKPSARLLSDARRAQIAAVGLALTQTEAFMDMDTAVALALQAEEDDWNYMSDVAGKPPELLASHTTDYDEALALALARDEENDCSMKSSLSGKAWNFVQKVLAEYTKLGMADLMELISADDMLFMVERLVEAQAVFRFEEKDVHVDIGYHYTRSDNLGRIRTDGLLSKGERDEKGVTSNYNGSAWGDGVYTANNPYAFRSYGEIGLLVARLKGDQKRAMPGGRSFVGDTAIANEGTPREMVILGKSYQCVPLVQFQRSEFGVAGDVMGDAIWTCHCMLQEVLDSFFNDGIVTQTVNCGQPPADWSPSTWRPSTLSLPFAPPMPAVNTIGHAAPCALPGHSQPPRRQYPTAEPTRKLDHSPCQSETCERPSCAGKSQDKLPSEIMRVLRYARDKLACDSFDTFVIVYAFRKTDSRENLTHRISYLPDTPQSRIILERLKCAFRLGLIDSVTWPLVPHRTSPYLSYRDYNLICGKALDELGVPESLVSKKTSLSMKRTRELPR